MSELISISISPRSPDVNCLENVFPIVSRKLERQAKELQLTHKSYGELQARVIDAFYTIPVETINKLIESMPNHINNVIAKKGGWIKC